MFFLLFLLQNNFKNSQTKLPCNLSNILRFRFFSSSHPNFPRNHFFLLCLQSTNSVFYPHENFVLFIIWQFCFSCDAMIQLLCTSLWQRGSRVSTEWEYLFALHINTCKKKINMKQSFLIDIVYIFLCVVYLFAYLDAKWTW